MEMEKENKNGNKNEDEDALADAGRTVLPGVKEQRHAGTATTL